MRARRKAAAATIALAAALVGMGCGETAESYCGNLYARDGVGTPNWAIKAGYFFDYRSCVDWYRANEPSVYN